MSEENTEENNTAPEQKGTTMTDVLALQKALDKKSADAAKWRVSSKEHEARVAELTPLADKYNTHQQEQMSEVERMTTQLEQMQDTVNTANAEARTAKIQTMALEAGVPKDKIPFIDTSKIDLDSPESATAVFNLFAEKPNAATSKMVNPAKGEDVLTMKQFRAMHPSQRAEVSPEVMQQLLTSKA